MCLDKCTIFRMKRYCALNKCTWLRLKLCIRTGILGVVSGRFLLSHRQVVRYEASLVTAWSRSQCFINEVCLFYELNSLENIKYVSCTYFWSDVTEVMELLEPRFTDNAKIASMLCRSFFPAMVWLIFKHLVKV